MSLEMRFNTFAGAPLDRAADRRADADWIAAQLAAPDSLAIALWDGQPLVETGAPRLALLPIDLADQLSGGPERLVFLGLREGGALFALDLEDPTDPAEGPLQGFGAFQNLRPAAAILPAGDAAIAAAAKALFEWRRRHQHCSVCGQSSQPADGGWKRVCSACGAEHFPRTDPVVIMLPHHGDRCMLGRQEVWPPGMFSALAGFMEPGECIEEACARELAEEAGLRARVVRYHSSQPWPFPNSLMIGLIAEVEDDEGAPDQTELSEVRWFTRAEARELLAGRIEGLFTPPPFAIAHQLLKTWAWEA
jgi:NAD+ diphosphatase